MHLDKVSKETCKEASTKADHYPTNISSNLFKQTSRGEHAARLPALYKMFGWNYLLNHYAIGTREIVVEKLVVCNYIKRLVIKKIRRAYRACVIFTSAL